MHSKQIWIVNFSGLKKHFFEKKVLIETVTIPKAEYELLKQTIVDLQAQVILLQEEIRLLKNGGKSNTSSTAPSKDIGRSNQKSLREKSVNKSGGQFGHKGSTLEMSKTPDSVIEYRPNYCNACGEELPEAYYLVSGKQEIEIPVVVPSYIEHRSYACKCTHCDFTTVANLPEHLQGNIQYGQGIMAWVGYLSVRQYVSYERIAEMMRDCFNLPMSQGTVDNILKELAQNAEAVCLQIEDRLTQSKVVGGDETGVKINGKKGWLFTFQTPKLTLLTVSLSRGFDSIKTLFEHGFPKSVYVSDCLAAQLKTPASAHQICLAHLLRELNNFIDALKCPWSEEMKKLLQSAIAQKAEMKPPDFLHPNEHVQALEAQLDVLLQTQRQGKHKKVQAFIKRLNKHKSAVFTFLHYSQVPADNNASERAIRNAKVKMKVSGQFKSLAGANSFAKIRSVIDTAIKNSQNVLQALSQLSKFAPE